MILDRRKLKGKENIRYARQIAIPSLGIEGQVRMRKGSALVVGAGGLGCPVALYLAGAGIGRLGILDHDVVELTNLHRQIGHTEAQLGQGKVDSLSRAIRERNSSILISEHQTLLTSDNALKVIREYDVVVDATDNVATRYLLNDACVLLRKPLVSGAALRMDGQLTTYGMDGGPCYRCIHPIPPPTESVTSCNVGGILGPVVGMIGSLQALEVIKILSGNRPLYSNKMLIFSGETGCCRVVKLCGQRKDCGVCGDAPTIKNLLEHTLACQREMVLDEHLDLLSPERRISAQELASMLSGNIMLVDVRQPHDLEPFRPRGLESNNILEIPLVSLDQHIDKLLDISKDRFICFVCRRGNDSQRAVSLLSDHGLQAKDVIGGMHEYARSVDRESITIRGDV